MSEQVEEAVNPGQAIYDALSDEAKSAVDALPDDVFAGPVGCMAAERIARDIQICAAESETIWALISDPANGKEFVALNVAMTNMVSCVPGNLRLVLRVSDQSSDALKAFVEANATYRSYSDKDLVQVGTDRLEQNQFPEFVIQAHEEELLNHASLGWRRNQRANWHRDDWRVKLGLLAAMELPAPTYVPADRIGRRVDIPETESSRRQPLAQWSAIAADASLSASVGAPRILYDRFASGGLLYTPSQIASFYTALQTKGFVILSGISGTGKSKIAQRFAGMLVAPKTDAIRNPPDIAPLLRSFERDSRAHEVDTLNIKREHFANVLIPDVGDKWPVKLKVGGVLGLGSVVTYTKENGSRITDINFPQELVLPFKELRADLSHFYVGLYGDVEKPLDTIALARTPTDLPRSLRQSDVVRSQDSASSNSLFLPVRPDWRDGKALIGYHNPLTGKYVRTDFLDFVIAAQDDYRAGNRNAFFVILDEMNLAHVEYYFADVLSVIESGRDDDGWTVEGIPLAVGEEDADLPAVLKLPPNLYIVGTVNMDETTHPFSPKVVDRAFTIELTDVDFRDYPPEPIEGDADLSDVERLALLDAFIGNGDRYPRIDKDDIRAVVERHGQFRADLENLNTSLKRYRMHFGYRVFDEIMQFLHNAELNGLFSPDEAFDHAVLMKVLPKFNGSRAKLERPLVELILWSRQRVQATEDDARAIVADLENYLSAGKSLDSLVVDSDDWRYPATGERAALMMQDLYTDGFASFG